MRTVLATLGTVVLLALAAVSGEAGDKGLAKFLLDGGKADLQKGNVADAVTKLEKARTEDPDLLEAIWWLGQAHEKGGATAEALRAYRDLLAALDRKEGAGAATKDEQALRKKAVARADALGAGEKELRATRETFAKNLLAFAREYAEKDRSIAARALRLLLDADPSNAEGRKLLAKVGDAAEAPAAAPVEPKAAVPAAHAGVRTWRDLIADRTFGINDGWEYLDGGVLRISKKGGTVSRPLKPVLPGDRFVLEMEVRVTEELERLWGVGLVLAGDANEIVNALLLKTETLVYEQGTGERREHGRADLKYDPGTWHRFTAVVEGKKVRLWLDDKKVLDASVEGRDPLGGDIGIFHQRCTAEIRVFRLGTFE